MRDDEYEVVIKSEKKMGALTYGEFFIEGERKEEVLFSTHICHPSMCNDNLSGISVNTFLAKYLMKQKRRYSYRFIFIPATIGAIAWLAKNEKTIENIKFGYVTALLGDRGKLNYKKSRSGSTNSDKIAEYVLSNLDKKYNILNFSPYGYDERQFCSPGINLPIGRLTRTPNNEFPEYHTSADNLSFISKKKLYESYKTLTEIVEVIETNKKYINLSPKCEPQLGKRGIYNSVAGNVKENELAMLWILNYSDGNHDLIDISNISGLKLNVICDSAEILRKHNLLEEIKS
jgi:aminopeptidase-like protein